MENIIWTDRVRNGVLHREKEQRTISHEIKVKKTNRVGHVLGRSCILKHTVEER